MNNPGLLNRSLFIGDLSKFCSESDLENLFSRFGQIVDVKIKRNNTTGKTLSYGFVTFASDDCASYAMQQMDGRTFYGRNLRIRWAVHNARAQKPIDESIINSVYVRFFAPKIDEFVTEEDFHKVFDVFGCVEDVSIKESSIDKRTNRQSGYGFVHFTRDNGGIAAAFQAVSNLDNATIDGVTYNVELSKNLLKQFNELKKPGAKASGMLVDETVSMTGSHRRGAPQHYPAHIANENNLPQTFARRNDSSQPFASSDLGGDVCNQRTQTGVLYQHHFAEFRSQQFPASDDEVNSQYHRRISSNESPSSSHYYSIPPTASSSSAQWSKAMREYEKEDYSSLSAQQLQQQQQQQWLTDIALSARYSQQQQQQHHDKDVCNDNSSSSSDKACLSLSSDKFWQRPAPLSLEIERISYGAQEHPTPLHPHHPQSSVLAPTSVDNSSILWQHQQHMLPSHRWPSSHNNSSINHYNNSSSINHYNNGSSGPAQLTISASPSLGGYGSSNCGSSSSSVCHAAATLGAVGTTPTSVASRALLSRGNSKNSTCSTVSASASSIASFAEMMPPQHISIPPAAAANSAAPPPVAAAMLSNMGMMMRPNMFTPGSSRSNSSSINSNSSSYSSGHHYDNMDRSNDFCSGGVLSSYPLPQQHQQQQQQETHRRYDFDLLLGGDDDHQPYQQQHISSASSCATDVEFNSSSCRSSLSCASSYNGQIIHEYNNNYKPVYSQQQHIQQSSVEPLCSNFVSSHHGIERLPPHNDHTFDDVLSLLPNNFHHNINNSNRGSVANAVGIEWLNLWSEQSTTTSSVEAATLTSRIGTSFLDDNSLALKTNSSVASSSAKYLHSIQDESIIDDCCETVARMAMQTSQHYNNTSFTAATATELTTDHNCNLTSHKHHSKADNGLTGANSVCEINNAVDSATVSNNSIESSNALTTIDTMPLQTSAVAAVPSKRRQLTLTHYFHPITVVHQ